MNKLLYINNNEWIIRHKNKLIFIFFLFAPIVLLIQYPLSGQLIVDSGDGSYYVNTWLFGAQNIYAGELPMWNRYLTNGQPTIASGSGALINIPALLLGWLPRQWFIFFMYTFHISFAAYFMYLYLKEIKCGSKVAFVVATMLLFSIHLGGFRKSHMGIIFTTALFPIVMYYVQRHLNTEKLKYLAVASGVIAFAFSYTQIQHVVYMAIASGFYFLVCSIKNKSGWINITKRTMLFGGLFFVFSAIILIPTAELMMEYAKHGTSGVTFEYFASFSLHPILLITMLFPYFFGPNIFQAPNIPSSEMNIELFIGATALPVLLYSIRIYLRRNFLMILSLGICLMTLAYMSIAHIPLLRTIVYNLPIIGSFRAPSRMLFIFIFFLFVIIALGLAELIKNDNFKSFLKFHRRFSTAIILLSVSIFLILISVANLIDNNLTHVVFYFIRQAFLPTCLILIIVTFVYYVIDSNKIRSVMTLNGRNNLVLATICLFILFETVPFFVMTNPTPIMNERDELAAQLSESIGHGTVFDAFNSMCGSHQSLISQNSSARRGLPSINAINHLNNPLLYRALSGNDDAPINFGGLLTGSLSARQNLIVQNDLLSMMGVKYIIDSSYIIPDEGLSSHMPNSFEPIFESQNFAILPTDDFIQVWAEAVSIKPKTYYLVIIDYAFESCDYGFAFIDLYDGHVNIHGERLLLNHNANRMERLFFSGNEDSDLDVFFRIVTSGLNEPIEISSLSLYEMRPTPGDMLYTPVFIDEHNRIFENVNARDVLYFSDEVRGIPNIDYIFNNPFTLNLDRISYIVDAENQTFDLYGNTITDIDFRNNRITGVVTSENGGFLNFSQTYFPGWRVYLNDQRAELEQVNALIMGVFIPPGTHNVTFSFVSLSFILGAIITCLGIVACVIIFGVIEPRRSRKKALSVENLNKEV